MRKVILISIIGIMFVAGCTSPPDKIIVDGVEKAMNDSESAVASLDAKQSVETVLSSLPENVSTNIIGKNTELSISAGVVIPNITKIYTAILEPEKINAETALKACFGDKASEAVKANPGDSNLIEYNLYNDDAGENMTEKFTWYSNGEFFYVNLDLDKNVYYDEVETTEENAPNCTLSKHDSIDAARKFLKMLGVDDINVESVTTQAAQQGKGKGFYSISFTKQFYQIPFANSGTVSTTMGVPGGTIDVGDEGVFYVSGNFMVKTTKDKLVDYILSIDELLQVIPSMMDTKIKTQADTPIETISLNYIAKSDESGMSEIVPVWVFDINQEKAKENIQNEDEYFSRAASDLVFNAVTGQLEALG